MHGGFFVAKRKDPSIGTDVTASAVEAFQAAILGWFRANRRSFPWRVEGVSLYLVVIAELMLQRREFVDGTGTLLLSCTEA